jgi:hypothetical protein
MCAGRATSIALEVVSHDEYVWSEICELKRGQLLGRPVPMITRRSFQKLLVAGIGVSVIGSAASATVGAVAPSSTYRYRSRISVGKRGYCSAWYRVKSIADIQKWVPFKVIYFADAAGKIALNSYQYISLPDQAHIVRATVDLKAMGWTTGSPLFYQLLLGEEEIPSKLWQVKASSNALV